MTLTHWEWESKTEQPHQKIVGLYLTKLDIHLANDIAIPLLDIYPNEMKLSKTENKKYLSTD